MLALVAVSVTAEEQARKTHSKYYYQTQTNVPKEALDLLTVRRKAKKRAFLNEKQIAIALKSIPYLLRSRRAQSRAYQTSFISPTTLLLNLISILLYFTEKTPP